MISLIGDIMPIACVLVANLPLKIELIRKSVSKDKATLVVEQSGTQKTVIDRSHLAHGP